LKDISNNFTNYVVRRKSLSLYLIKKTKL